MRLVIIESPFAAPPGTPWHLRWYMRWLNIRYARRALRDSLMLGEAPIASHLLHTQRGVLRDHVEQERIRGINAGLAWFDVADAIVFYMDRGMSGGMLVAYRRAVSTSKTIERRFLG